MKCSCGCHVFDNDKKNVICYSCECQIDKMPKTYNTISLEEFLK